MTIKRRETQWNALHRQSKLSDVKETIYLKQNFNEELSYYHQPKKKKKNTRGYQKVRRLMQWNQYFLSYANRFYREYKTTNVLLVVKVYVRYVLINHFIIKYILYGMVTRRSLFWVPWRSTTSLIFHVTLYIFNTH